MKVVLREDVEKVGLRGEVVDVARGYARNFLLPRKLAEPASPARVAELEKRAATRARQEASTFDQARELADRIYPPQLEVGGLVAALRSAAAEAEVPARIEIARDQTYPPEVAGAIFFCFRDLLENVSAGSTVAIRTRSDGAEVAFDIAVDGDLHADRSLIGDRIEALGGGCAIQSEPGHLTRVIGSLPLSG